MHRVAVMAPILLAANLLVALHWTRPAYAQSDPPPPGAVAPAPPRPDGLDPSASGLVLVEFARNEHFTFITVGQQTHLLPCSLWLRRGVHPIIASGKEHFAGHVVVEGNARFDIADARSDHRIAGAVLVPVGLVVAAGFWAFGLACDSGPCFVAHATAWPILGTAALFTGVGLLGYAAGGHYELRELLPERPPTARLRGPRLIGLGLSPVRSGAMLGAALEF